MDFVLNEKEEQAKDYVCLALDIDDKEEVLNIVEELSDLVGYFKLNFAFTNHGPEIIREIKNRGGKIFLDLKFHDIPNTVAGYARAATRLGIDMFNVHASGGKEMMKAAVTAADEEAGKIGGTRPKIIGVTILTSIDQVIMNKELNMQGTVESQVLHLAKLTDESGLDGIVFSAADLQSIKNHLRRDFLFVTPGIKGVSTEAGSDQKRVYTPKNAVEDGSSLLVIGRPILAADDRRKAAYEILQDIAKVL
jgi:orotidine-5'-phosphate decarboxylase